MEEDTVKDAVSVMGEGMQQHWFKAGGHGWGQGRGEGGHQLEHEILLEEIHDIFPTSGTEWGLVVNCHSMYFSELKGAGDQLKKKFKKLSKTEIHTGNPNKPK